MSNNGSPMPEVDATPESLIPCPECGTWSSLVYGNECTVTTCRANLKSEPTDEGETKDNQDNNQDKTQVNGDKGDSSENKTS